MSFQIQSALGRDCPLLGIGSKQVFIFLLGNWKLLSNVSYCGAKQLHLVPSYKLHLMALKSNTILWELKYLSE